LIRVLLVDDHKLVRAGLQSLLAACEDIEVVGSAADGHEALELAGQHQPDVVLMDLSMPGMGGVEATRRLLAAHPDVQVVVVLTSFSDQEQVLDAVDAGAVGYLLKDADPDDLVAGVRANKQIARHLGISERTVKAHLTSIFQTIGVTDRTQAALWAERNGLRGGGA